MSAKKGFFHFSQKSVDGKSEFQSALSLAHYYQSTLEPEECAIALTAMTRCIKASLQNEKLSAVLYKENNSGNAPLFPFPYSFMDECGELVRTQTNWYRKIRLNTDAIITEPWNQSRWLGSILHLAKTPFRAHYDNHEVIYFSAMDIAYVCNGNHSIAAGVLHGKGTITAQIIADELLLNYFYCDWHYVYEKKSKQSVGSLADFRVGLLFELARILHEAKNNQPMK